MLKVTLWRMYMDVCSIYTSYNARKWPLLKKPMLCFVLFFIGLTFYPFRCQTLLNNSYQLTYYLRDRRLRKSDIVIITAAFLVRPSDKNRKRVANFIIGEIALKVAPLVMCGSSSSNRYLKASLLSLKLLKNLKTIT